LRTLHPLCAIIVPLAVVVMTSPTSSQQFIDPGETYTFSEADRCEGTPFVDTLLKGTASACYPPAEAEAYAVMSVGAIKTDVEAFSSVITDLYVPSGAAGNTVLDATVSADVEWNGVLFGASVIGGGAQVKIEMLLVNEVTGVVTGKTVVESVSQDSTGLKGIDVGGTVVNGHAKVSFAGKVTRGQLHSIQLKVTCKAESGLIGLDVGSIFFDNFFGAGLSDYYVKWTSLSITVEQDLAERLDQIEKKVDQLDAKLLVMDKKLNEIILLLLTPQGLRSTDVLVCDGEACDFPKKPGKPEK
jgi:hypothetical protein